MHNGVGKHNIQYESHGTLADRKRVAASGQREVGGPQLTTDDILGAGFFERFAPFVKKSQTCWLWTAGRDAYGYGQIARVGKSPIKVHRAAWMLAHGPIASDQHVLHKCDVRHCVNPDHLFLGDQAANMKDAAEKGRLRRPHPGARRLSTEDEQRILSAPQFRGVTTQLAREFGVSVGYVSLLRRGLSRRAPLLGSQSSHA